MSKNYEKTVIAFFIETFQALQQFGNALIAPEASDRKALSDKRAKKIEHVAREVCFMWFDMLQLLLILILFDWHDLLSFAVSLL